MTGLTDPMDDFYARNPELVDLDRALDTCHKAHQAMLASLAEYAPRTEVDEWQDVVDLGLAPGDVVLVVNTETGYSLAWLDRIDAYVVDADEADR